MMEKNEALDDKAHKDHEVKWKNNVLRKNKEKPFKNI